jgi:hypothetical protein
VIHSIWKSEFGQHTQVHNHASNQGMERPGLRFVRLFPLPCSIAMPFLRRRKIGGMKTQVMENGGSPTSWRKRARSAILRRLSADFRGNRAAAAGRKVDHPHLQHSRLFAILSLALVSWRFRLLKREGASYPFTLASRISQRRFGYLYCKISLCPTFSDAQW